MSEPAISVAFFDPAAGLHGIVRTGVALLFEGRGAAALADVPELQRAGTGFRAAAGDDVALELEPLGDPAELGGQRTSVCRVRGSARGRALSCLGTATETAVPPSWDALDAIRGVSAIFDEEHAVLCVARRPRGALAHGDEDVRAVVVAEGRQLEAEDARLSTVYDGAGRQRSASLELWLPGEDFPRRAFGSVEAGTTLHLEQLRVNAAVFGWRMDGREGAGAYELVVREPAPAAA